MGVAFLLPAIAYIYEKLAQTDSNAPKGCSVLLLQPMGAAPRRCLAQMSAPPTWPWNARPQKRPLRLLAEFRVRAQKTRAVLRDLKLSGPITRPHSLPISIDEAPRQPCHPCATSGAADGGPSQRWGSPSLVSGLRPCSHKRRAAPRARTPRAAHHEPGARAPEGVRMQRLIAIRGERGRPRDTPSSST